MILLFTESVNFHSVLIHNTVVQTDVTFVRVPLTKSKFDYIHFQANLPSSTGTSSVSSIVACISSDVATLLMIVA